MCSGFVFFFKQKTAYEMRISDWSSDVCSSDLLAGGGGGRRGTGRGEGGRSGDLAGGRTRCHPRGRAIRCGGAVVGDRHGRRARMDRRNAGRAGLAAVASRGGNESLHGHADSPGRLELGRSAHERQLQGQRPAIVPPVAGVQRACPRGRSEEPPSEEHTSELQSLMRTSYAVFCLKKTKPHT